MARSHHEKETVMTYHPTLSPEQKEQARHGEYMFPLQKYITTLSERYPSVSPHWHDEAELTLVTSGACTYQIHLDTYEVETGDILFVPPAVLHSITASPSHGMCSETYVFHMNFLGANTADICAVKYLTPLTNQTLALPRLIGKNHPAYNTLLDIFRRISRAYADMPPGYELLLRSFLLQAIVALLPYSSETEAHSSLESEHTFKLKLVLEYIGEHYAEELTISELSRICYFSEYHFMRFIKKYVGSSCLEYIKNLRLEKAAEQFAQGERSVLDTALACGFGNLSYFYREFKKKYGMTPKKFIENIPSGEVHTPYHYQ